MALMINMLGYFLGHYPQHFELSDPQRNLILQTMLFFLWLAGGAGVFARIEGWLYVDAVSSIYRNDTSGLIYSAVLLRCYHLDSWFVRFACEDHRVC